MTHDYSDGSVLDDDYQFHVCPKFPCEVAKISGRNCAGDYENSCQTYKFKQKYGEDYLHLGVGAMMIFSETR